MVRVKQSYTNKTKIAFWLIGGGFIAQAIFPQFRRWVHKVDKFAYWWNPNYEEWKERERHRWNTYLKNWDNKHRVDVFRENMGTESNTTLDQWLFGKDRYGEVASYEECANQFIKVAEQSGLDPAKKLYDSIKKVCDAYYPTDLDPSPSDTSKVIQSKVEWIHEPNFDEIIENEKKKPKPNSLGRYLWFVPGYNEYFNKLKNDARYQEEKILMSLNMEERQIFYENMDRITERWSHELNDYTPLLAHRLDRKHKLAKYLKNPSNEKEILECVMKPGGIKQLFINAGIINPTNNSKSIDSVH